MLLKPNSQELPMVGRNPNLDTYSKGISGLNRTVAMQAHGYALLSLKQPAESPRNSIGSLNIRSTPLDVPSASRRLVSHTVSASV